MSTPVSSQPEGIGWEMTDRKRPEDTLREQNELLSFFLKYSPIYAFIKEVTPTESRVLAASENFKDMVGVPGSAMVGCTMDQLFPAEFAAKITADDWAVVSGGQVLRLDEDLNGRNYMTIKYPILLGDKKLLAGYTIEITDRKQAAAEKETLEAQNRQLQKSESLGRMAGAIAHHFNNQLQAVMGNLELALQQMRQLGGPTGYLTEALKSTHKAADVSRMMLAYLGQTQGQREPVSLAAICQESLSLLCAVMPPSVVLETDLPSPGPAILANPNQVQQVLTNLLTNAWEAGVEGKGAIQLTVSTVAAAAIPKLNRFPIDWKPQDPAYACLAVIDQGCGIAPRDIENLFDPFFSTKFTGRGLGLSLALGIVRAHGGAITVESQPGRGSAFRVFWPLSTAAPASEPAPEPVAPAQTANRPTGRTILVVEDEPMIRETATLLLEGLGFRALPAKDGPEAIELLRRRPQEVDCVLCDLTMPRLDGWQTLAALRQLVPGIPVILCSGYSEAHTMAGHHPELPQAFLSKPYESQALNDTLLRVLKKP